jgi:catalase
VRSASALRADDSDFGQAGTLYRDVFSAEAKARFLETLSGQASAITIDDIRERFFQYWTNVDAGLGAALREAYAAGVNADVPEQPEAAEDDEAA